jgi:hypothetical protein
MTNNTNNTNPQDNAAAARRERFDREDARVAARRAARLGQELPATVLLTMTTQDTRVAVRALQNISGAANDFAPRSVRANNFAIELENERIGVVQAGRDVVELYVPREDAELLREALAQAALEDNVRASQLRALFDVPQDATTKTDSDTREAWHDAALQHVDSPDPMTRLGASVVALSTSLDETDATRATKLRSLLDDFGALAALPQEQQDGVVETELCSSCGELAELVDGTTRCSCEQSQEDGEDDLFEDYPGQRITGPEPQEPQGRPCPNCCGTGVIATDRPTDDPRNVCQLCDGSGVVPDEDDDIRPESERPAVLPVVARPVTFPVTRFELLTLSEALRLGCSRTELLRHVNDEEKRIRTSDLLDVPTVDLTLSPEELDACVYALLRCADEEDNAARSWTGRLDAEELVAAFRRDAASCRALVARLEASQDSAAR